MDMPFRDHGKPFFRNREDLGDPRQEGEFLLVHQSVSLGDVEERVDDVFEHRAELVAGAAHIGEVLRIGFETRHILTREIVETRDVAGFLRRELEDLAEGFDLGIGDDTVSLGIFAESAMIATEKDTRRRVSGSPSKAVRTASTMLPMTLLAVSPIAPSKRSQNDDICSQAKSKIMNEIDQIWA